MFMDVIKCFSGGIIIFSRELMYDCMFLLLYYLEIEKDDLLIIKVVNIV